jgi:hypothetical protein
MTPWYSCRPAVSDDPDPVSELDRLVSKRLRYQKGVAAFQLAPDDCGHR